MRFENAFKVRESKDDITQRTQFDDEDVPSSCAMQVSLRAGISQGKVCLSRHPAWPRSSVRNAD